MPPRIRGKGFEQKGVCYTECVEITDVWDYSNVSDKGPQ
jgi:hypothetical protein